MGIINRDIAHGTQRAIGIFQRQAGALATGITTVVCSVPWPASLDLAQIQSSGLSGSPVYTLWVDRFIVGTGATAFAVGTSTAAVEFGTSGMPVSGMSIPQIGSTVSTLLAGDRLSVVSGGANSAVLNLSLTVILRPISDIIKIFGLV